MSTTFKNALAKEIGLSLTPILTVPGGATSTVIGLSIANVGAVTIYPSVRVTKGATVVYLVKSAPVPVGSTLVVLGGDQKLVLMAGDVISVISDVATSVDAILSYLETV
jgi:hypothetical protein